MVARLKVTSRQARDLAVIRDVGPQRLKVSIEQLKELQKPPVAVKQLHRIIADDLGAEPVATVLTRVLVGLSILSRQYNISASDLVDGLTEGLESHRWDDDDIKKWHECAPVLQELLSLEAVIIVAKAIDLSFDYANLFGSARILTDIRPVFDDEQTKMLGAVVSHVLRISYATDAGRHSLSIAMDEKDVARLHKSCEEALAKMKLAKELIDRSDLEAITAGEEGSVLSGR